MKLDFSNPAAFEPFYSDTVSVTGARASGRFTGTFAACVLDDGLEDPLADVSTASTRRRAMVYIPKTGDGGWNDTQPPQVGDTVTVLSQGSTDFAVSAVKDFMDSWVLTVRQTGGEC